jgi:mannitol 2-dehydrogenase
LFDRVVLPLICYQSQVKRGLVMKFQKQNAKLAVRMWECVGMVVPEPLATAQTQPSSDLPLGTNSAPLSDTPRLSSALVKRLERESGAGASPHQAGSRAVALPTYDRNSLTGGITHIGVGGFHRAHLALYVDDLAQAGSSTWSITGSGVTPHDSRIASVLSEQDGLYLLVEREGEHVDGRIIGSLTNFVPAEHDPLPLLANLVDPNTRILSLTITEGAYPVEHGSFVESESLAIDVRSESPRSTFGLLIEALDRRRKAGLAPFTVLCCDNLPGNGHVARTAILGAASLRSTELAAWIERNGAFPNAMVDRITPQTTDADRAWVVENFGFVDGWPVVCEPFRQWALEDHFVEVAGKQARPPFEEAGALMTSDVLPYEHMKLRLLNGSHSALAYHAALAGIKYVHDATQNPAIQRFIRSLMKDEAVKTLAVAPVGIDLDEYQESLVRRFSNPAIADTIARLCLDGTGKFPTFIVSSLESQLASGGEIRMLTLAIAGWCRYLQGVADDGSALVLSGDPFLAEARSFALRSTTDPTAFLQYERALGPNLSTSTRLAEVFTEALSDLKTLGSLATLERWTTQFAGKVSQ